MMTINRTVNSCLVDWGLGKENELAFGEDDSDVESEFTDGIRYMLAELAGESGLLGLDDYDELGNIDRCE